MKVWRLLAVINFVIFSLYGCSSSIDTASMSVEERYNYCFSLFEEKDYEKAVLEFEAFLIQYPGSVYSDKAQYYLALSRFRRKEFLLAAYEFSRLIKSYPSSDFVAESQYLLAESYYNLSPSHHLDQKYTKKAIEEYQAFLDFFPSNPKAEEAEKKIKELNEKLALKEFSNAELYEKMEFYNAAIFYYTKVEETYFDTKYAPMALYRKIKLLEQKNRKEEALRSAEIFIERYPNDSNINEIKKIYERLSVI